jgi:hypothetical protein
MRLALLASVPLYVSLVASTALAADPWVDRPDTLPRGDFAFDVGLGVVHNGFPNPSLNGAGTNLEFGVGIAHRLELGVRTGIGFGDDGQALRADVAGRLFDRQTFDTGTQLFSNPEVRLRGAVYRGDVAEVALEGRVVVPFADGTRLGAMFGVPLAFHVAGRLRIDTGVFIPVIFDDQTTFGPNPGQTSFGINVPVDVWFQITRKLWLGPETGVYYLTRGNLNETDIPLGFGLGISLTRSIDFKAQGMFPAINQNAGAQLFTAGGAFQFRIE